MAAKRVVLAAAQLDQVVLRFLISRTNGTHSPKEAA
jgi:hypothetical protein